MERVLNFCLGRALGFMGDCLGEHISYHMRRKEYVDTLKDKQQRLEEHVAKLRTRMDDEMRNGNNINPDVYAWNYKSEDFLKRKEEMSNEMSTCHSFCCIVCYRILVEGYFEGKKAHQDITAIDLLLDGGNFDEVGTQVRLQSDFSNKNFIELESRSSTTNRILEALKSPDPMLIGLYGLSGVGKSDFVKRIASLALDSFDDVCICKVSDYSVDDSVLKRIQDEIADKFKLKLEGNTASGRSEELKSKLERRRKLPEDSTEREKLRSIVSAAKDIKFLVILEDVRCEIKLDEIGIPMKDGCKVLITSENKDVLCINMGVKNDFRLDPLSYDESEKFFKELVGEKPFNDPSLETLPLQVVLKCGGYPGLLTTVARALRDANYNVWKDVHDQLDEIDGDTVEQKTNKAWKLIVDKLSEEVKKLFIMCGQLWQSGIPHEYLLYYVMGLNLIEGFTDYQSYRSKFFRRINELKASCLLQDGTDNDLMTMDNAVHSFAISLGRNEYNDTFISIKGRDELRKDVLENCFWLLISSDAMPFSPSIQFSKLRALIVLDSNFTLNEGFFDKMKELKVLDITKYNFSTLPSSFQHLLKLQTLCFRNCDLSDVKAVGILRELKILSFESSYITNLPIELGQLTQLEILNIENCKKLEHIPPNLLSELTNLKELLMDNSFSKWETDDSAVTPINANIDEISFLTKLVSLRIRIPNAPALNSRKFPENLERFKILIGECEDLNSDADTTFQVALDDSTQLPPSLMNILKSAESVSICASKKVAKEFLEEVGNGGLRMLKYLHIKDSAEIDGIRLKRSFINLETLQLQDCDKLKTLFRVSVAECLPKLQKLAVKNCKNFEAILADDDTSISNDEVFQFPQLRSLELEHLPSLSRSLFDMKIALPKLEGLTLFQCNSLKYVITTNSVAKFLSQLKTLEIFECNFLEEIVFSEENISSGIILPNLMTLYLVGLENLFRFCDCNDADFGSLNNLVIYNCPKMVSFNGCSSAFFKGKVTMPHLRELSLSGGDSIKMLWHNEIDPDSFGNLKELTIDRCSSLENLGRLSVINNFEVLDVSDCSSLKEMFYVDANDVVDSKLRDFRIGKLPNLKEIWRSNSTVSVNLHNLSTVEAYDCSSLRSLFPASFGRNLQRLESLKIRKCESLKVIIEDNETSTDVLHFPHLKTLKLSSLKELVSFCVGVHKMDCPSLEKLLVFDCKLNVHSLFSLNKILSNLHSLSLNKDKTESFLLNDISFENVKTLQLQNFRGKSEIFPTHLVQRFSGIEKLILCDCDFEEIPNLNERITTLKLYGFEFMGKLMGQNLTRLTICECRHSYLFTPEIVRSLQQLVDLRVQECNSLSEIMRNEGNCENVIFSSLEYLELLELQNLRWFTGDAESSVEFPSLVYLWIINCPAMNAFSKGPATAPELCGLVSEFKIIEYRNDLNETFKRLYDEQQ